ncbi:MAG: hypothetical protein AAF513_17515 [Pseudomonadota bacterium]
MRKVMLGFAVVLVLGGFLYTGVCPCGPVPGAYLFGEVQDEPVGDWSFVNDLEVVPLCQLQVSTWRPHSINLNCMADDGRLFVSCSNCADKSWSNDALRYPHGRLRAAGKVYPVLMRRLIDGRRLDTAWAARLRKIGSETKPRPEHWWSFELASR